MIGDEERFSSGAGGLAVALVLAELRQAVDLGPHQVGLLTVSNLRAKVEQM